MMDFMETNNIPFLLYDNETQKEKVIGIVHWVSDNCFNVTLFDVSKNIFYREYNAETKALQAIGMEI